MQASTLSLLTMKLTKSSWNKVPKDIEIHLVRRRPGSRDIRAILRLNGIILRNQFDVIHSHGEELIKVVFIDRNKSAITIHDVGQSIRELKLYGKLFAISQAVRQDVYEGVAYGQRLFSTELTAKGLKYGIILPIVQTRNSGLFK